MTAFWTAKDRATLANERLDYVHGWDSGTPTEDKRIDVLLTIANALTAIALQVTKPKKHKRARKIADMATAVRLGTVALDPTVEHPDDTSTPEASDICTCGHQAYQHQATSGMCLDPGLSDCPCQRFTPRYNATTEDAVECVKCGHPASMHSAGYHIGPGGVGFACNSTFCDCPMFTLPVKDSSNPASVKTAATLTRDEAETLAEKIARHHWLQLYSYDDHVVVKCRCGWQRSLYAAEYSYERSAFITRMHRFHAAYIALVGSETDHE